MKIYSTCPVVRTETMKLWQQVTVAGKSQMVSFEREIAWLRDSDTKITIEHRGVLVDTGPTLNDFGGGYLVSLEAAAGEAKRIARKLKIRRGDVLAIVANLAIVETPVMIDTSTEAISRNSRCASKQYQRVERDWYTNTEFSPETGWPRLESIEIETLRVDITNGKLGVATKRWLEERRKALQLQTTN